MRPTQVRKSSEATKRYNPEGRQSLEGQQNRYFTNCRNEINGHKKKSITLPKLMFLEKGK